MLDETQNLDTTGLDDAPTPVASGDPGPGSKLPIDHTIKLDRAIVQGDLSLPSHFGRYEVLSRIGIGGFASVYAARDPELEAPVAVKVLAENHSADSQVRRRFVAEARVARRLGSDRLIGVFDVGETDDGRPYVVMELATGGTLRARVSRIGRPTKDSLLRLIDEIGACLTAIHDRGVVHRDIKPSNLLIRQLGDRNSQPPTTLLADDERIVLADFGLARDISDGASAVTVGGGTAGYMAPEQADPEGKADFRADIYAATVVLAELTTGRHPERLDLTTARLTPRVRTALEQSLSIDRERRPSSAAEWRDELYGAYRTEATTSIVGAEPSDDATAVFEATQVQAPFPYNSDVDDSWLDDPSIPSEPSADSDPPPPPPSIPLNPRMQPPAPGAEPPATSPNEHLDRTEIQPQAQPQTEPVAPSQPSAAREPIAQPATVPHTIGARHRSTGQPVNLSAPPPAPQSAVAPPATVPGPAEPTVRRQQAPQSNQPPPPRDPPPPGPPRAAIAAPAPVGPPVAVRPATALQPETSTERSKKHLKTAQRLARLEQKQVRKRARQNRRRRRRRRVSNFFRAIIRGILASLLTLIVSTVVVAAYTNQEASNLSDGASGFVGFLAVLAFFIGIAVFPFPRRLDV